MAQRAVDPVPEIEWWDLTLLTVTAYEQMPNDHTFELKLSKITNLVEHPIPAEPPNEKTPSVMPMFLTQKERKKMRRSLSPLCDEMTNAGVAGGIEWNENCRSKN